jgi:hypothetical protein
VSELRVSSLPTRTPTPFLSVRPRAPECSRLLPPPAPCASRELTAPLAASPQAMNITTAGPFASALRFGVYGERRGDDGGLGARSTAACDASGGTLDDPTLIGLTDPRVLPVNTSVRTEFFVRLPPLDVQVRLRPKPAAATVSISNGE